MKRLPVLLLIAFTIELFPIGVRSSSAQQTASPRLSKGWKRVTDGNLVAIGDASEKALREALGEIAGFRAALEHLYPSLRLDSPVPYRVVLFDSPEALRRYAPRDERGRPQQYVGGYFASAPDLNVIALGGGRSDVVFHEFTHSLVSRNFHSLPGWLNEGLAEFHSTFEADWRKGQSLIGRIPVSRMRSLRTLPFLPVKEILFATPADMSKLWRSPERIAMYYAESWALVHYLQIGRQQAAPGSFGRFVSALERGRPVDRALRDSFDASVEEIDGELRRYIMKPALFAVPVDLAQPETRELRVEPMTEADVSYIKGDMLARVGALDEAEKDLANALTLDPTHVAAKVALAGVRVEQDRAPDAIEMLQPILQSAPENFSATYRLATALAAANRHLEALETYGRCTKLLDASPDAWYGLSVSALALGRVPQANAAMLLVQNRRSNPGWYRSRAYAALRLGLDAVAAEDARRYVTQAGWDAETVYTALVAAIAHLRLKQPQEASEVLENARGVAKIPDWTLMVIDYLDDRVSLDSFLGKARSVGEKTEAHTYIGFRSAIAGRHEEALLHLQWVRDHGAHNYVEFEMAKGELKRLEAAIAAADPAQSDHP
jgi:tetratricopeptide (TPR) repeat protein